MLTEIRDRSTGTFAWFIALLIIIPMAFWGVQEYTTTQANPSVAEVGEQKISQEDFRSSLNSEQQRIRARMGDNPDDTFLNSDGFKQSVLERMVNRALIQNVAAQEQYRVSNQQLANEIQQSDLFKLDGKFNKEAYERFLISSQYSKSRYEESLREDLALQQVTAGYEESAIVLPDEVRVLLEAQAERRTFDIVTLSKAPFLETVSVTDAEIEDYYNANQAAFMQPQKVAIEYLELNRDALAEDIEVSDETLRQLYEQNAQAYVSEAKRQTRHILLSTTGDDDADAQLAKAQSLVSELRNGADFASYAERHSDDTGSAQNGGSLGMVERGQMVAEFEEATFSLEKEAISDPVKSQFGYHIIQVLDIEEPKQKTFDEVRFELLLGERNLRADEKLLELADQLQDLAFEQSDNLDAAAELLGYELRTTELFSRDQGEGIAANPLVRNMAFSDDVLIDELNSEPFEIADGQTMVLRKLSEQEAAPKALTEVSADIKTLLTAQKASEAAATAGDELLAKAKLNWNNVWLDSETASSTPLTRNTHTVSLIDAQRTVLPEVMNKISGMQVGQGAIASVADRSGDVHLLHLRDIQAGDLSKISEQIKEATRRIVAQRNGGSLLSAYIDRLKQEQAPQINADLL